MTTRKQIFIIFIFLFWLVVSLLLLEFFFWFVIVGPTSGYTYLDYLKARRFFLRFSPFLSILLLPGLLTIFFKWMRVLVLTLGPILGLLLAVWGYLINAKPCEGFSCLDQGIAMVIGGFYWMILSALIPIAWSMREPVVSLSSIAKKSFVPGIVSLVIFALVWFGSTYPLRSTIIKERTQEKERLEKAKQEMTYLEPSYFPKEIGVKYAEQYSLGVETKYMCGKERGRGLTIDQTPEKHLVTKNIDEIEEDIIAIESAAGQRRKGIYSRTVERVSVGNSPAIYIVTVMGGNRFSKELLYFTSDSKVILEIYQDCNVESPKEALIKIAESMKPLQ